MKMKTIYKTNKLMSNNKMKKIKMKMKKIKIIKKVLKNKKMIGF
jgi:hypothetical protein